VLIEIDPDNCYFIARREATSARARAS